MPCNQYVSEHSPASPEFGCWMMEVFQQLSPGFYKNDHDHSMCHDLMRFFYGQGQ